MKLTLLEIVQDILNDMDADNVNSIDDTIESQQVAQIVKTCYYEISANRNWPHQKKLITPQSSSTLDRPTYIRIPVEVKEIEWIKYNKHKEDSTQVEYRDVRYLDPFSFLTMTHARNSNSDDVQVCFDLGGTPLLVYNNRAPAYWTSFDDDWIVFDSYDKSVDDTIKSSKVQIYAYASKPWETTDDFVPDLPAEAFPALVEEAKSTAFIALKQMANQKAEQKASRQQRWLARKAWRAHGGIKYPNFGRTARK